MKDFRDLMIVGSEMKMDGPFPMHSRMYRHIPVGEFNLSIQASEHHYCNPRCTLPLNAYSSMEMAIFRDKDWVNPKTDEQFKNFERLTELSERWEDGEVAVGGYIPVDLIQALCDYIEGLES